MSNFQMGPEYGQPGFRWSMGEEDLGRLYDSEHSFDPGTGDILGPLGPVPAHLAIRQQSIHNQLVWRARNRMAQDAVRGMQGAAGTMSSFRAGGGAALESGVFAQTAGLQMQRANMMQPMDLMGDFRRDQAHRARGGGGDKWGAIGGAVLSAVGTGVSMAGYPYIGIPLSAAGAAISGASAGSGGGYYPQQGGQQRTGQSMLPGQPGQPGTAPGQDDPANMAPIGTGGPLGGALNAPAGQGGTGQAVLGGGGQQPSGAAGQPQGGGYKQTGPVGPPPPVPAGAGGPAGPGGVGGDAPPGGGGAFGAGGGYIATGAGDGAMTPQMRVAKRFAQSPYAREIDAVLSEALVEEITNDPTYDMLTAAFDQEVALRYQAGAA